MNISRWVGFVGAGVVLGACSGYSSLGEVAGGGGESGQGDGIGGSQSMGAKGGQGYGGTVDTGGAQGMGARPGMVGGGSSMGAVGGIAVGGYGGTGMGTAAVGGTDGPVHCMTDAECPTPVCDAAAFPCPEPVCAGGYCGLASEAPCENSECGELCRAPDGTIGKCDATGDCVDHEVMCGLGACRTQDDCGGLIDAPTCGDDQSGAMVCLDEQCQIVCQTELMCTSSMDCPKELLDDPCTSGPWECPQGFCARRHEDRSAPMQ